MFPHCIEASELPAPLETGYAGVVDRDTLAEERQESGEVGEVLQIRDEERVGGGHMRDILVDRFEGGYRAEQAL